MKLIPILLLSLSCSVFGADKAQPKVPEISSIQSEYEFDLKSSYATYMTEVKKLEAKVIKKMEDRMKSIASTDLDKAILIKAEIEKVKSGSMRQAIIDAFANEKGSDLLGNEVEKKDDVFVIKPYEIVGKWKLPTGYYTIFFNDGTVMHKTPQNEVNSKGTCKYENNKVFVKWAKGQIDTYSFPNNDTAVMTNYSGKSWTFTRVIESK